jgi:hypothetical protein
VKSNTFPGHWISLKVISPFTQASSNLADAGFELDVFGRDLFEVDSQFNKKRNILALFCFPKHRVIRFAKATPTTPLNALSVF